MTADPSPSDVQGDSGKPAVICLMGPTAAGKSALAMALADRLPVDIVSVDAAQVYRGLDIGTAKPTPQEQQRYPHRLIDIRDPAHSYSAADFRKDALREIEAITQTGRVPLLVGGTMFYFKALMFGLSNLPSANPAVRERLSAEAERVGWGAMHTRLAGIDPESAARIHPNDPQRTLRALEVFELSGETLSAHRSAATATLPPYRFVSVAVLADDREALNLRITTRFRNMLDNGLVAEVERLRQRADLHLSLPAIRTVGYRQTWEYLSGTISYSQMVETAIAATRQLAKRQMTWLRTYPGVHFLGMPQVGVLDECLSRLRNERDLGRRLGL